MEGEIFTKDILNILLKMNINLKYLQFKIEMLNLKNISSTPVTLLKKTCRKEDHLSLLHQLTKDGNARVFSVYQNDKTASYLHSYIELRKPEIKSYKIKTGEVEMKKADLYLADFTSTKKILLNNVKKRNIDFCDVLLINDFHFDTPEKSYFILLWLEMFKRSDTRPYLLITTDCYLIPELPFDLDKISIQEFGKNETDFEISYHNENFSPNSLKLIEAIVDVTNTLHTDKPVEYLQTSLWLIFYSGKRNLSLLNKSLYDKLENINIYSYNNISDFSKILNKGTRTIITIDEMYEDSIFLEPDGVIDSMVSEYRDENEKLFYQYSSKQSAEVKSSYLKNGFCYRLCTEDFFEQLQKVQLSSLGLANLEKQMLEIVNFNIGVTNFYSPLIKKERIKETVKKLKILENITPDDKITKLGKVTKDLNLKVVNGSLLLDWIKNGEPSFPMIVFLVFSELNYPFIHFPYKNYGESRKDYLARKEEIIQNYYKESYETIFELYLKVFLQIIISEKTINIKNYNLICKKYNLNYLAAKEVFTKIKFLTDYFKKYVKIGIFNVENLVHLSKTYLEKFYYNDLGTLIDDKKGLYSFKNGEVYKLDGYKHFNDLKSYPTKIVVFEKCKVNDSEDSIQKSKSLIYYFVPLNNVYIEK
jgi:hypothetical protein